MFLLKLDFPSGNCVRGEECDYTSCQHFLERCFAKTAKLFSLIHSRACSQYVFGVLLDTLAHVPQLKMKTPHDCSLSQLQEAVWAWNQGSLMTELVCFIFSKLLPSFLWSEGLSFTLRQCSLIVESCRRVETFFPSKDFHYSSYKRESIEVVQPSLTMWQ